jgi:hypothetical protein
LGSHPRIDSFVCKIDYVFDSNIFLLRHFTVSTAGAPHGPGVIEMLGRIPNISLQGGTHSRVLSSSSALDETASPQESSRQNEHTGRGPAHARNLPPFGKGRGHSVEDLVDPKTHQFYLRKCNEYTDSNLQSAQGVVEILEDGNSRLRSMNQWLAHAMEPGNAKNDPRIAKYRLMTTLTTASAQKSRTAIRVLKLETEAKVLAAKSEHKIARERNEVATDKYDVDLDDYQTKLDASRAAAAPAAAQAAAPAAAPLRSRGKSARATSAGSAAASPAAAPAGAPAEADTGADAAADRAAATLAALRAPVKPISIPAGELD